jgi:ribosomal protein S27AE
LYREVTNDKVSVRNSPIWLRHGNIPAKREASLCFLQDRNMFLGEVKKCPHCGESSKAVDHLASSARKCSVLIKLEGTTKYINAFITWCVISRVSDSIRSFKSTQYKKSGSSLLDGRKSKKTEKYLHYRHDLFNSLQTCKDELLRSEIINETNICANCGFMAELIIYVEKQYERLVYRCKSSRCQKREILLKGNWISMEKIHVSLLSCFYSLKL